MTSAAFAGGVSGAATGAAAGSFLGPIGAVAGGLLGGVAGLVSGGSQDAQQANNAEWAAYNRTVQYNNAVRNAQSQLALSAYNAQSQINLANFNAAQIEAKAGQNAAVLQATVLYNDSLLENQLTSLWENMDLDLAQLDLYRLRERGNIVADQAASGTVIGEGSNAEVVISQETQRAMDANIIMFGAQRKAADIANARAKGLWEGGVAVNNLLWEGQNQARSARVTSQYAAHGTIVNANILADAGVRSASSALVAGGYSQANLDSRISTQNTQNLAAGLFSAASIGVSSYARTLTPSLSTGNTFNTASAAGYNNSTLATQTPTRAIGPTVGLLGGG